jgi:hypothetical protein
MPHGLTGVVRESNSENATLKGLRYIATTNVLRLMSDCI